MLALIERGIGSKALYRCECGIEVRAFVSNVTRGHTKSCGCLRNKATGDRARTHGHKPPDGPSRTYAAWINMRQRCNNPSRADFKNYGGRGIYHSPRWISFEVFLADMGECPEGLTLDRKDTYGHYYPLNCRWADKTTQMRNKRTNRVIEHEGEALTLAEWSERSGVAYHTLMKRLDRGVPMALALSTPRYLSFGRIA